MSNSTFVAEAATGPFRDQQLIALAITLSVFGAAMFSTRKRLLIGKDNRVSTSKVIVVLWTAVVAYSLTTLALIAGSDPGRGVAFVAARVAPLDGVYLVLLGGPFAAWVLAKVVVTSKIGENRLQKPVAESASVADITNNDEGRTDVVDLQYTVFNLIVMAYVLAIFIPHPAEVGLVDIPDQLALLTGSSAAVYVSNKFFLNNEPKIRSITPRRQRPGGVVVVNGENLWFPHANTDKTAIEVGDFDAEVLPDRSAETLQFRVPDLNGQTEPMTVRVTTNAGAVAESGDRLTIDVHAPERPR